MDRCERVELTVLCLIEKDGKILFQNRVGSDWQGYTMPGGHIERDESVVDAVIREVYEETGLTVKNPKLVGVKQFPIDDGRYLVFFFRAYEFSGTLTSSVEGEVEWIDRSEVPNIKTVADFDTMLKVFDDENLTEFIYKVDGDNWRAEVR